MFPPFFEIFWVMMQIEIPYVRTKYNVLTKCTKYVLTFRLTLTQMSAKFGGGVLFTMWELVGENDIFLVSPITCRTLKSQKIVLFSLIFLDFRVRCVIGETKKTPFSPTNSHMVGSTPPSPNLQHI